MYVYTLFHLKNRDLYQSLIFTTHVCGNVSRHGQKGAQELLMFIRLEKVTKPSLKRSYSTNPQSDKGGNPGVLDQQISHKEQGV